MRLELVDPVAFAEPAHRILSESWEVPHVRYSMDYLRWQFGFPGALPPTATAVWEGEEPVAFTGVTPRRVRLGGLRRDVYLSSFHAVRPRWRGAAGAAVLRLGIRTLRSKGATVAVFAEPGSAGEQMVLAAYRAFGYKRKAMGTYRTYAWLPRGKPPSAPTARPASDGEFLAVVERCTRRGTLWNDPTPDQLTHYRSDPRGRALAVATRPDGEAVGAAMVATSEVVTASGTDRVASLDGLFMPRPSADALKALLYYAKEHPPAAVTSPVVTCPNAHGAGAATLRAVGMRETAARAFRAYLFCPGDDPLLAAEDTNLEVV